MKSLSPLAIAIIALVIVTVFWGLSFPLIKMSNTKIETDHNAAFADGPTPGSKLDREISSTAGSIALRFGLALSVLALFMPRQILRMTGRQWLMGATVGFVYFVGLMLQVLALNEISASRSGFLTSLTVVFTPFMMIAVTGRRPPLGMFLAIACAAVGAMILFEVFEFDAGAGLAVSPTFAGKIGTGDVLTVIGAAVWAVEIILVDVFSRRMPPTLLTPGMFAAAIVFGGGVFGMHALIRPSAVSWTAWTGLVQSPGFMLLTFTITVIATVLPFYLMNKYQAFVSPTHAALIYTLEPIFATLGAMILPRFFSPLLGITYNAEVPSWSLICGGGVILAANFLGFRFSEPPGFEAPRLEA